MPPHTPALVRLFDTTGVRSAGRPICAPPRLQGPASFAALEALRPLLRSLRSVPRARARGNKVQTRPTSSVPEARPVRPDDVPHATEAGWVPQLFMCLGALRAEALAEELIERWAPSFGPRPNYHQPDPWLSVLWGAAQAGEAALAVRLVPRVRYRERGAAMALEAALVAGLVDEAERLAPLAGDRGRRCFVVWLSRHGGTADAIWRHLQALQAPPGPRHGEAQEAWMEGTHALAALGDQARAQQAYEQARLRVEALRYPVDAPKRLAKAASALKRSLGALSEKEVEGMARLRADAGHPQDAVGLVAGRRASAKRVGLAWRVFRATIDSTSRSEAKKAVHGARPVLVAMMDLALADSYAETRDFEEARAALARAQALAGQVKSQAEAKALSGWLERIGGQPGLAG